MDKPLEQLTFITQSLNRVQLLSVLAEGPQGLSALVDEVDASTRTVKRGLQGFVDHGHVRSHSDGTYELTHCGRLFRSEFFDLMETNRQIEKLRSFFEWFPEDLLTIEPALLLEAHVTLPESAPPTPSQRVDGLVENASVIKAIVSGDAPFCGGSDYTQALTGSTATLLVSRARYEMANGPIDYQQVTDCFQFTLLVAEEEPPFGLLLTDETVAVCAVDAEGSIRAMVDSQSTDLREWGETLFDQYTATAHQITTSH